MEADWTKMMKGKIIKCLAPALKADKETIPIAVIISGRNYGQFLGDCIESVQRQDPAPAEIIYMDNASEDGSIAVARAKGVDVCVIIISVTCATEACCGRHNRICCLSTRTMSYQRVIARLCMTA